MDEPDSPGGADCHLASKVALDVFILLSYTTLYYFRVGTYNVENHIHWFTAMLFAIISPWIFIVVGIVLDGTARSKRTFGKFILIIFTPTFWILWLAFKTVAQDQHSLQMMIYSWSFKGLFEIPVFLLIQLYIFLQRTPVGNYLSLQNGRFLVHSSEIVLSFFIFLYTVGKYHNLLDNNFNFISTIKVFPYFAINILFRTFTMAVIFLYVNYSAKPLMFVVLSILYICNVFITYRWSLNFTANKPHKIFSAFIGGFISIFTPAFGCFFGETSTGKCVRSYYRINTYIINTILGVLFFIISMVLIGNYNHGNNTLINQFPLAGCHPRNYTFPKDGAEFGFKEVPIIEDNFPFLGSHWTVRLGNKYENTSLSLLSANENEKPVFLVAQLCEGDFTYFNFFAVVVPVVIILLILSTLSAVYIDHMGIKYRKENIEDEDLEMFE